jgi:chromosome segregation protein
LPFENASPGQQATALLSILPLQDGPPLIIDQPEDDLNMKIINEIVATLWKAKPIAKQSLPVTMRTSW